MSSCGQADRRRSCRPLNDPQLRRLVRHAAGQLADITERLNHPHLCGLQSTSISASTRREDLAGILVNALNRCYLEPTAVMIGMIDQMLDLDSEGSDQALRILHDLLRPLTPPGAGTPGENRGDGS